MCNGCLDGGSDPKDDSRVYTLKITDFCGVMNSFLKFINLTLLEMISSVVDVNCLQNTRIRCMILVDCMLKGGNYPVNLMSLIVKRCSNFYLEKSMLYLNTCEIYETFVDSSISSLDGSPLRELKLFPLSNYVLLNFDNLKKLRKLELSRCFCENGTEFLRSTNLSYFSYDKYVFGSVECALMYSILKKYRYKIDVGDLVFEMLTNMIEF